MTLKEACVLGRYLGFSTIEECIDNVVDHATDLFYFEDASIELIELTDDFNKTDFSRNTHVVEILGNVKMKEIDNEVDDVFHTMNKPFIEDHLFEDKDGGFFDDDLPF